MKALYRLSQKPATFDFVAFACIAKTMGCDEVVFDLSQGFQKKKFPESIARRHFREILAPVCSLFELNHSLGSEGRDFGYRHSDALRVHEEKGLWLIPYRGGEGMTITIRQSIRNKHRDSNRPAWDRFAKETGARIIEDAYVKPISIEERMALYQSRMNFVGSNGPSMLLFYSEIPYTMFSPPCADDTWPDPIRPGFQFPWRTKNQRIVWANDTYEEIRAQFDSHCQ